MDAPPTDVVPRALMAALTQSTLWSCRDDLYPHPDQWDYVGGQVGGGRAVGVVHTDDKNNASLGTGRALESMTSFCKYSSNSILKQTR